MNALIFGINGQDGYYLHLLLRSLGYTVHGVSRSEGNWIRGSVTDLKLVSELIKTHQPELVFHLAANSTTHHTALFENHETISTGSLILLESVYKNSPSTKVFLSGSAMQFENKDRPINEKTPFEASNAYAISRIQSVYAARYYRTLGVRTYVGYFFNHESPLRGFKHISKLTTDAVKRISTGSNEKVRLGNINVLKEWNFAGDFAEAIYKLVDQTNEFECVIGSGKCYSIADWLEVCFNKINKNWKDHFEINDGFKAEYKILQSDPKLLFSLGYKPKVDFFQLAELMMKN